MVTGLAFWSRAFYAVVVIDIVVRGVTCRAGSKGRVFGRVGIFFNRLQGFALSGLILSQKEFVVFGRGDRFLRGVSVKGCKGSTVYNRLSQRRNNQCLNNSCV